MSIATGSAALGEALVLSAPVRMTSFTGGFAIGELFARSAGLKRLAIDLGGNAPLVFTNDLHAALEAAKALEAAGAMINDSSDYRFDAMPFGGFKYGSMGREGRAPCVRGDDPAQGRVHQKACKCLTQTGLE